MTTPTPSVRSQCPYCGVGCGLELLPPAQPGQAVKKDDDGNPMWTARGDRSHPSSQEFSPPLIKNHQNHEKTEFEA